MGEAGTEGSRAHTAAGARHVGVLPGTRHGSASPRAVAGQRSAGDASCTGTEPLCGANRREDTAALRHFWGSSPSGRAVAAETGKQRASGWHLPSPSHGKKEEGEGWVGGAAAAGRWRVRMVKYRVL